MGTAVGPTTRSTDQVVMSSSTHPVHDRGPSITVLSPRSAQAPLTGWSLGLSSP